ncbi:MAG: alpha/beta fold hydrolase [Actinomycetota bacterium]|nr:alpha/beta fold hydrolase [Actinomycetota bacterium]
MVDVERRAVSVAGHRLSYLDAGPLDAPVVVLVHGLLSTSGTWGRVVEPLAAHGLRVIALDLVGHGESDKPRGSYLLDDFALSLDRFFDALNIGSATMCGHSLGGAIAVHFGYHFPKRVERLVLVSAGGLGREVNLVLRALSMRGAERVTAAVMDRRPVQCLLRSPSVHRAMRVQPERLDNLRRIGRSLMRKDLRAAFFASLRAVIEPSGQRGSFVEMRYLAEQVPTLLVWSREDGIIPVAHAEATHALLPGSRLVIFDGGGHEPHHRNAVAFADEVASFIASHSTG